jgi:hypothetical protein
VKTSKKNLQTAIESKVAEAKAYMDRRTVPAGMTPVVFVQRLSHCSWFAGFRFSKVGTAIGDIQLDCHSSAYPDQEIVWVNSID